MPKRETRQIKKKGKGNDWGSVYVDGIGKEGRGAFEEYKVDSGFLKEVFVAGFL